MTRAILVGAALVLASCASPLSPTSFVCTADSQCGSGQVCFAEGCGDPGRGVVVEVEGGSLSGQFAREFPLASGLSATQSFELGAPLSINGQFQRVVSSGGERTSYTDAVVVRATGQSLLLPGITRTYEARFSSPERGFFEMKVGAGDFNVAATPADPSIPPLTSMTQVAVNQVTNPVTFAFPAVDGATSISGQIIRRIDSQAVPPEPILVSDAFVKNHQEVPIIELQLFDPDTDQPLSQRIAASTLSSEFAIVVSPEIKSRAAIAVVATPRDLGVPVPTKRFILHTPVPSAVSLEYGEYGEAGEASGDVLDADGLPVVGAQVALEGTVGGGGTFRSRIVETDIRGHFSVVTLPSGSEKSFTLSIVPPHTSRASISQRYVTVTVQNGITTTTPSQFTLEDRLIAHGLVLTPNGSPAAAVHVRATIQPQSRALIAATKTIALEPSETMTDSDGTFTLPLEAGIWRFDYSPSELLPLSSRLVTISPEFDPLTGLRQGSVDLHTISLSYGRTISGVVTGTMGARTAQEVPYSQLRFFRVTTVEGKPASILLGSTIADERGRYSVVLPAAASMADGGIR